MKKESTVKEKAHFGCAILYILFCIASVALPIWSKFNTYYSNKAFYTEHHNDSRESIILLIKQYVVLDSNRDELLWVLNEVHDNTFKSTCGGGYLRSRSLIFWNGLYRKRILKHFMDRAKLIENLKLQRQIAKMENHKDSDPQENP